MYVKMLKFKDPWCSVWAGKAQICLLETRIPGCVLLTAAPLVCFQHVSTVFWVFLRTFEAARQLSGKQHVGQFALAVGQPTIVAPLAVKVVETDPAEVVGQGRDHHDPGRPAALQEPSEEVRQQKVAWIT